ncbi:MAG: hypothetical protein QXJ64_03535 [Thermosphaera sp.]
MSSSFSIWRNVWKDREASPPKTTIWTREGVRRVLSAVDVVQQEAMPRIKQIERYYTVKDLLSRIEKHDLQRISEIVDNKVQEVIFTLENCLGQTGCFGKTKEKYLELLSTIDDVLNKVFNKYYSFYPADVVNEIKRRFREELVKKAEKIEVGISPITTFEEVSKKRSETEKKYKDILRNLVSDLDAKLIKANASVFNKIIVESKDESLKNEALKTLKCFADLENYTLGINNQCPNCPQSNCELCLQAVFDFFNKYENKLGFAKKLSDYLRESETYKQYESLKSELVSHDAQLHVISKGIASAVNAQLKKENLSLDGIANSLIATLDRQEQSDPKLSNLVTTIKNYLRRGTGPAMDRYSLIRAFMMIKENENVLKNVFSEKDWELINKVYEKITGPIKLEISPETLSSLKVFIEKNEPYIGFKLITKLSQETISNIPSKMTDISSRLEKINSSILMTVASYVNTLASYFNQYSGMLETYSMEATKGEVNELNSIFSGFKQTASSFEKIYKEFEPYLSEIEKLMNELNTLMSRTDVPFSEKLNKHRDLMQRINTLLSKIEDLLKKHETSLRNINKQLLDIQSRFDQILNKIIDKIKEKYSPKGLTDSYYVSMDKYLRHVLKNHIVVEMNRDLYEATKKAGPLGFVAYAIGSGFLTTYANLKYLIGYIPGEIAKVAEQQTNPILKTALRFASGTATLLLTKGAMMIPGLNIILIGGGLAEAIYTGVKMPEIYIEFGKSITEDPTRLAYIAPMIIYGAYSGYKAISSLLKSKSSIGIVSESVYMKTIEASAKLSAGDKNVLDDFINYMKKVEPKAYSKYADTLRYAENKEVLIRTLNKLELERGLVTRYAIASSVVSTIGSSTKLSAHTVYKIVDKVVKESMKNYKTLKIDTTAVLNDLKTLGLLSSSIMSNFAISVDQAIDKTFTKLKGAFLNAYYHIEEFLKQLSTTVSSKMRPVIESIIRSMREYLVKLIHVMHLEEGLGLVSSGMHKFANYVLELTKSLGEFYERVISPILYWLATNVYAKIHGSVEKAIEVVAKLGPKALDILNKVKIEGMEIVIKFEDFLKTFFTKFSGEVNRIVSYLSKAGQQIISKIKDVIDKIDEYLNSLIEKAGAKINKILEDLDNKLHLSKFYRELFEKIEKAISKAEEGASRVAHRIEGGIEKIVNAIKPKLVEMKMRIKPHVERIVKSIEKLEKKISHEIKMRTSREYRLTYGEKVREGSVAVVQRDDGQIEVVVTAKGELSFEPLGKGEKFVPRKVEAHSGLVYETKPEGAKTVVLGRDVEQVFKLRDGRNVRYVKSYVSDKSIRATLEDDEVLNKLFKMVTSDVNFKEGKVVRIPIVVSQETDLAKLAVEDVTKRGIVEKTFYKELSVKPARTDVTQVGPGRFVGFEVTGITGVSDKAQIDIARLSVFNKFDAYGYVFEHKNKVVVAFRTLKGEGVVGIVNPEYGKELLDALRANNMGKVYEHLPKLVDDLNNFLSGGKPVFYDFALEVMPRDFAKLINEFMKSIRGIESHVEATATVVPKRLVTFAKINLYGETTMAGQVGSIEFYDVATVNIRKPIFMKPTGEYVIESRIVIPREVVSKIINELDQLSFFLDTASPDEVVDVFRNLDLYISKKLFSGTLDKMAIKEAVETLRNIVRSAKESISSSLGKTSDIVRTGEIAKRISEAQPSTSAQTIMKTSAPTRISLSAETKQLIDTISAVGYGDIISLSEIKYAPLLQKIVLYSPQYFEFPILQLLSSAPAVTIMLLTKLTVETKQVELPTESVTTQKTIVSVPQTTIQTTKIAPISELGTTISQALKTITKTSEREEGLLKYVVIAGQENIDLFPHGEYEYGAIRIPVELLPHLPAIASAVKGYASPEELEELLTFVYQYEILVL